MLEYIESPPGSPWKLGLAIFRGAGPIGILVVGVGAKPKDVVARVLIAGASRLRGCIETPRPGVSCFACEFCCCNGYQPINLIIHPNKNWYELVNGLNCHIFVGNCFYGSLWIYHFLGYFWGFCGRERSLRESALYCSFSTMFKQLHDIFCSQAMNLVHVNQFVERCCANMVYVAELFATFLWTSLPRVFVTTCVRHESWKTTMNIQTANDRVNVTFKNVSALFEKQKVFVELLVLSKKNNSFCCSHYCSKISLTIAHPPQLALEIQRLRQRHLRQGTGGWWAGFQSVT